MLQFKRFVCFVWVYFFFCDIPGGNFGPNENPNPGGGGTPGKPGGGGGGGGPPPGPGGGGGGGGPPPIPGGGGGGGAPPTPGGGGGGGGTPAGAAPKIKKMYQCKTSTLHLNFRFSHHLSSHKKYWQLWKVLALLIKKNLINKRKLPATAPPALNFVIVSSKLLICFSKFASASDNFASASDRLVVSSFS